MDNDEDIESKIYLANVTENELIIPTFDELPKSEVVENLDPSIAYDEYVDKILNNEKRIEYLEPFRFEILLGEILCNYCSTLQPLSQLYYCKCCRKNMCKLCKWEFDNNQGTKGSKNYAKRKDRFMMCKNHDVNLINDYDGWIHRCDMCEKFINYGENVLNCMEKDIDICESCLNKPLEQFEKDGKKIEWTSRIEEPFIRKSFMGSLLDWVPIYKDKKEEDYIYYNANPKSPYYQFLACSCIDDHGREGFSIYDHKKENNDLETLLNDFVKYKKEVDDELSKGNISTNSWDTFYNTPIKMAMASKNCPIHFG